MPTTPQATNAAATPVATDKHDSSTDADADADADTADTADTAGASTELTPPEQKIALAAPHKQRGNELFREHRFTDAKKAYDDAFVCVFAGRDEFDLVYTDAQRRARNEFVVPLHLNRGLCKTKLGDYEGSLWDFDEAQRLTLLLAGSDGSAAVCRGSAKALYRRARARMALARRELDKVALKQFCDDDKVAAWCKQCRADLRGAAVIVPTERAVRDALADLGALDAELREMRRRAREKSRAVYSAMARGRAAKSESSALDAHTDVDYACMPPLERVRLY